MHIGFDYDGVISQFEHGVNKFLRMNNYEERVPTGNTEWHFYRQWGWTDKDWSQFWKEGVRQGIIFGSKPLRGAVDGINAVYKAGHKVHIITHRGFSDEPGLCEDLTARILARDEVKYHSLTFSGDKTIVWTDMMVDDKPENYEALKTAGTDAYLLTRPWNKHIEGAQRVRSCAEFCRKVLERN